MRLNVTNQRNRGSLIIIDGMLLHCSIYIANALGILQSCITPSIHECMSMEVTPNATYSCSHIMTVVC